MNRQLTSIFTGLIAGTTLAVAAVPAQAFNLQPNSDGTIMFDKATKVDFTFLESHGMFRSDFLVYNTQTNQSNILFSENRPGYDRPGSDANGDWLGTCGVTVTPAPCTTWYMFDAGVKYKFSLTAPQGKTEYTAAAGTFDEGVAIAPITTLTGPMPGFISDADVYNRSTVGPTTIKSQPGGFGNVVNWGFQKLDTSKYDFFVAINDSHKVDGDIQDFIVGAEVKDVPEPTALGGLGLVAGAMTFLRRRKNNRVS